LLVLQIAGVVSALAVLREIALHPSLFPLLPLGALAGVALAARPEWTVPGFVALCAVLLGRRQDAALSVPIAAAAVTLLALVVREAAGRRELALRAGATTAMFALPLVAAGLVAVGGPMLPGVELTDLVFLPLAALALLGARGEQALVALAGAAALLGAGALYSVAVEPTGAFPVSEHGNAAGPLGDTGALALTLAALVPITLSLALGDPGWRRALGIAAAFLAIAGIVAAGSLFALLLAAAAACAYAILPRSAGGRPLLPLGVVLLLLALPPAAISAPLPGSPAPRPSEPRVAFEMLFDRTALGVGPGRYRDAYPDYADVPPRAPDAPREPESLLLRTAAEQGMAGLVGWAGAVAAAISFALAGGAARTRSGLAVLCGLGAYAGAALVLGGGHLRLLYVFLGLMLAAAWTGRSRTSISGAGGI
jgi:hypothetical protein